MCSRAACSPRTRQLAHSPCHVGHLCCFLCLLTVTKSATNTLVYVFRCTHVCLQKLEAEWCVLYSEALTEMSPLHRPCGAPELSRPQQTFHHTNTRQVEVRPWVWTGTGLPQLPTLPQGSSEGMLGVGGSLRGGTGWSEIRRKALMESR